MPTYSPTQLGIKAPTGGFQQGGWYNGRQYWGGTLSDPGQIHPMSNQVGAGQLVSKEVNLQSDQAQGNKPGDIERYLESQRQKQVKTLGTTPTGMTPATTGATSAGFSTGMTGTSAGLTAGAGVTAPINLPSIYQGLYESSGISGREGELVNLEKQYLEAKGKISDNPFLSASMVDQRLQRLEQKYKEQTDPIRSEIAMKRADIETQLNLQSKQFDINSQASRDALNYFNTLLEAGALTNASGEDIAQLTMMTGIPSSALQSAIKTSQEKNKDTQVITSTADSGEVTVSVIDKQSGQIISQSSLGMIGNKQTGGSGATQTQQTQQIKAQLAQDARDGIPLVDYSGGHSILSIYSGWLDPNEIYAIYNANSVYGSAKESPEELAKYGIKTIEPY